jgi:hypothetical protein
MLHKVASIFKSVYNKYSKSQKQVEPVNFGEWYLQSEDYRKLNLTTMPEAIDSLFNEGVNYYG